MAVDFQIDFLAILWKELRTRKKIDTVEGLSKNDVTFFWGQSFVTRHAISEKFLWKKNRDLVARGLTPNQKISEFFHFLLMSQFFQVSSSFCIYLLELCQKIFKVGFSTVDKSSYQNTVGTFHTKGWTKLFFVKILLFMGKIMFFIVLKDSRHIFL